MKKATTSQTRVRFTHLLGWMAICSVSLVIGACSEVDRPNDADKGERPAPPPRPTATIRVVFLGNSIVAGNGIDPDDAFPALIQERVDSLGWPFEIVNAGVSGETTAGGLRRLDWLLREQIDVLVIELGANDGLRGLPVDDTRENLRSIIRGAREANPDVEIVLAGMQLPPNLGGRYTGRFRALFPELAEETGVALIPFVLEGVAGVPELNQADGIHPTSAGHRIIADTVWSVLQPILVEKNSALTSL